MVNTDKENESYGVKCSFDSIFQLCRSPDFPIFHKKNRQITNIERTRLVCNRWHKKVLRMRSLQT